MNEKFARYTIGQADWRWTNTAPAGQCLLFVGQSARECESCTWNRRFCTEGDDAFCSDRSSCGLSSEDCGESRPTDSHVSGIIHVARQGKTKRGEWAFQSLINLSEPWPTHLSGSTSTSTRWRSDSLFFLKRDELAVCLERTIAPRQCHILTEFLLIGSRSCHDLRS